MKADRRAQSARPRGMSLANSLREAKGGACPPFLRSYAPLTFLPTQKRHLMRGWFHENTGVPSRRGSSQRNLLTLIGTTAPTSGRSHSCPPDSWQDVDFEALENRTEGQFDKKIGHSGWTRTFDRRTDLIACGWTCEIETGRVLRDERCSEKGSKTTGLRIPNKHPLLRCLFENCNHTKKTLS